MGMLVVKENVSAEGGKDFFFADTAEEKGLINMYIPCTQSLDRSLMSRCIS